MRNSFLEFPRDGSGAGEGASRRQLIHVTRCGCPVNAISREGDTFAAQYQELYREANTLGSKSSALELTNISVEMKVAVEQMREQVQNIE